MNGLRVYTNTQHQETQGGYAIFYCRRDDGPYYRWSYEEQRKQWRSRLCCAVAWSIIIRNRVGSNSGGHPAREITRAPDARDIILRRSLLAKDDLIPAEGTIIDKQPNAFFKVQLDNSTHVVLAAISGKMRKHRIRILVGDRVSVEMSPYDLSRGRITYRYR